MVDVGDLPRHTFSLGHEHEDSVPHDAVARPAHYTRGKIEVRNFIRDQQLNFNLGSVIKYVCRAGFKSKDTHLQDLRKARQFLDFEIEAVEGELDASAE